MATKQRKTLQKQSTQTSLPIAEIRNNVVILKDGGMRMVFQVSTINFQLKSDDEQMATLDAYQQFLNTIDFPIQIVIQSRKVDLEDYFVLMEKQTAAIENPLLKNQARDYEEFLKKISEYANIMQKTFYVVIPADPVRSDTKKGILAQFIESMSPNDTLEKVKTRHLEFESLHEIIEKRGSVVRGGLERCGLRVKMLENKELITLYYQSYNPFTARIQKLQDIEDYALQ